MATIGGFDPARNKALLLNTGLQNTNNPLYQVLYQMINALQAIGLLINNGSGGGGGGGVGPAGPTGPMGPPGSLFGTSTINKTIYQIIQGSSSPVVSVVDYVVASDGATPTPSPLNDGFGNFIYVLYTP